MKQIEAIIRPEKVSDVCGALDRAGLPAATVSSVEGQGVRPGWTRIDRSTMYTVKAAARAKVEVVVADPDTDRTVQTISAAAATGKEGDGTIYIHDVVAVVTLGTFERSGAAL